MASQEDFRSDVEHLMAESGLSFIQAVYSMLEIYLQKEQPGFQIACSKGCSACCYQLVTCTGLEFEEIIKYIQSCPASRRKDIKKGAGRFVRAWQKYHDRHRQIISLVPLRVYQDWWGKPCPFLSETDGVCRIYPVRPIDCRTMTSTKKCPAPLLLGVKYEGVKRMRFDPEKWANNLIMEEEKGKNGVMTTTPLHHWILAKGLVGQNRRTGSKKKTKRR